MISMLICSSDAGELEHILSCSHEKAYLNSEERWEYFTCSSETQLDEALAVRAYYDIACLDITISGGLEAAVVLRRNNPSAHIVLIADGRIPPPEYVRPIIKPAGLLLRPFDKKTAERVIEENLGDYLARFYSSGDEDTFVIDNRDGRQMVPYKQILYLESREKKIVLYTEKEEYSFYETLDSLEGKLGDDFVRCHRSFIVQKNRIEKIVLSQNLLILTTGELIPVSRSYRARIKELR